MQRAHSCKQQTIHQRWRIRRNYYRAVVIPDCAESVSRSFCVVYQKCTQSYFVHRDLFNCQIKRRVILSRTTLAITRRSHFTLTSSQIDLANLTNNTDNSKDTYKNCILWPYHFITLSCLDWHFNRKRLYSNVHGSRFDVC